MTPPTARRRGLVSVVVPAFNAERGLRRCLDSVLAQTYPRREVILVDDGSTDGTAAIAREYTGRLRVITQPNRGECAARNAGLSIAEGEYLSFLDHDDYWDPAFLDTCIRFLDRHSDAAAVSTASDHRSALSARVHRMPSRLPAEDGEGNGRVLGSFFTFWADHDHVCAGSVVLRGSLFDAAGGQREDLVLSGDLEYWGYLATFGRWGFIPRVLLHVDGTQSEGPGLYEKFHRRYQMCASVAEWEARIAPRISHADRKGFERVRGRVATWYVFAKVFVGRDREAFDEARAYRAHLHGKYGMLWRAGLTVGTIPWMLMARLLRVRVRAQYRRAARASGGTRR